MVIVLLVLILFSATIKKKNLCPFCAFLLRLSSFYIYFCDFLYITFELFFLLFSCRIFVYCIIFGKTPTRPFTGHSLGLSLFIAWNLTRGRIEYTKLVTTSIVSTRYSSYLDDHSG